MITWDIKTGTSLQLQWEKTTTTLQISLDKKRVIYMRKDILTISNDEILGNLN